MSASRFAFLVVVLVAIHGSNAQPVPPDYGIDFVTINHAGNAPWTGIPGALVYGRGSVAYDYRIGRYETTTAQWLEFVNTFAGQSPNQLLFVPTSWGATRNPADPQHWMLGSRPNAATIPIYGINWHTAAFYCNWLNNGKPSTLAEIQNGAYDTSTFTRNPDGTWNDQRTHNPDAKFWIPTLDEWMKAGYYDPDRYGPGQEGWWQYDTTSDTAPVSGLPPPGPGETSTGVDLPNFEYHYIPLGAYVNTTSPWGLFDTSGAGEEWTEETFEEIYHARRYRILKGSWVGPSDDTSDDLIWRYAGTNISDQPGSFESIRIASIVPTPPAFCQWLVCCIVLNRRRRC